MTPISNERLAELLRGHAANGLTKDDSRELIDRLRAVNREHEKEFVAARDLCEIYFGLACIGSSEEEVREKVQIIIKTRIAAAEAARKGQGE